MGFPVGGARLVVNEGHLAEEVAAVQHGQRFLAYAGDELGDAHPAVEDDVELVASLALPEDHRALAETLFRREGGQQLHFRRREATLLEEVDLVLGLDSDLLHLALPFGALASLPLLRVLLEEELELFVGVADLHRQRAPKGPMQADGELLVLVHELVEGAEGARVGGRGFHGHGIGGPVRAVDEVHLAEDRVGGQGAEDLWTEWRLLADLDAAALDDVEVHGTVFLVEDEPVLFLRFDAGELREREDALVLHVLEDDQLAQLGGDRDQVVALLSVARDLLHDLLEILARLQPEEVLLPELQALGGELQMLDAFLDTQVEILRLDVVDALEGVDHPAHRLGRLSLLVGGPEEGVDAGIERALEVLQFSLDPPLHLGH